MEPPTEPDMALVAMESPEPVKPEQVSSSNQRESKRQKRLVIDDAYHYDRIGIKSSAMERAEAFTSSLTPPGLPTFLKTLVRSNVGTGYWLHLPMGFCKSHMPRQNTTVILEDEGGEKYEVNYIVEKTALSAGWKVFTTSQNLLEGDVVIFQLIEPSRFKVYVIRANDPMAPNGMSDLDASIEQIASGKDADNKVIHRKNPRKRSKPVRNTSMVMVEAQVTPAQNGSHEVIDPNINSMEGTRFVTNTSSDFEVAKSTGNFRILANGKCIDSELSETQRTKYYKLCMTQNSYLHCNLLKSISPKLAAEMISETVNIAATIRTCVISTTQEDYLVWDKTLEGFELLGMRVGFLRTHLGRLRYLTSEFEKCRNVETQKDTTEQEMRTISQELSELKELRSKLDSEIEALKASIERHDRVFQQEASAAW
ncbi:hypothetical protein SAY87_027411 [Trapa incisa]|uniref:TF-B3 domain-containing protein n=1 Tax=Trapa incisa TaxID=236973 RepID=A0AAN7JLX6_9MYRT|nr:hypothetical protein SAY87_027411 [Trapa incisa]